MAMGVQGEARGVGWRTKQPWTQPSSTHFHQSRTVNVNKYMTHGNEDPERSAHTERGPVIHTRTRTYLRLTWSHVDLRAFLCSHVSRDTPGPFGSKPGPVLDSSLTHRNVSTGFYRTEAPLLGGLCETRGVRAKTDQAGGLALPLAGRRRKPRD